MIGSNTIWTNMYTLWKLRYQEYFPVYEEWWDWFFGGEEAGLQLLEDSADEKHQLLFKDNLMTSSVGIRSDILIYFDMEHMGDILKNPGNEAVSAFFLFKGRKLLASGEGAYDELYEAVTERTETEGFFYDKIHGEKVIVIYRRSAWTDGIYVSVIHERMIGDSLRGNRLLFGGIVVVTIAVALCSALFFSLKTASPWNKLLDMIELNAGRKSGEVPYSIVNRQIERILQKNSRLAEQLDNLKTAMLSNLMTQLMTGQYMEEEELVAGFAEAGFGILSRFYVVIIVTINEVETNKGNTLYRLLINETIREKADGLIGFYELDIQDEAILFTAEEENYVDVLSKIEKELFGIQEQIQKKYNVNISFSGSMCTKIETIAQCVQEAKIATGYEEKRNNLSVSWYKKSGKSRENCKYSLDMEVELFHETVKGNVKKVDMLLEKIQKDNFIRNLCSDEAAERLVNGMLGTVSRLMEEKDEIQGMAAIKERIAEKSYLVYRCKEQNRMRQAFDLVCEMIRDIGEYYYHGMYDKEDLYQGVQLFIDHNFTDNQLSLTMVADTFQITEIYLSKFFKEKNGMNFSKYVESLRMKMARELLEDSAMSVQDIAEKVGYNSPQVFRRVYKKYYGKTPRE